MQQMLTQTAVKMQLAFVVTRCLAWATHHRSKQIKVLALRVLCSLSDTLGYLKSDDGDDASTVAAEFLPGVMKACCTILLGDFKHGSAVKTASVDLLSAWFVRSVGNEAWDLPAATTHSEAVDVHTLLERLRLGPQAAASASPAPATTRLRQVMQHAAVLVHRVFEIGLNGKYDTRPLLA